MSIELRLRIAGVGFRVELPRGAVAENLASAWSQFGSRDEADTLLEVEIVGSDVDGPLLMPEAERLPDGSLRIWGRGFEALAAPDRRRVLLRQTDGRFPIDSVLKMLLADRLAARGGLLIHSVAVAVDGRAGCFIGNSGAGKSTLGNLCAANRVARLSDELVAVAPEGKGFAAFGTPWNVGTPAQATLALVGSLAWGDKSFVEPAPPVDLLRLLVPNTVLPDPTPEGRGRLFRAASALLAHVPVVRLTFARDPGAAAAVRAALAAV